MRRVVSLYLPSWPIDRRRRTRRAGAPPSDAPLALVGRQDRRRVLVAVNPAARLAGLHEGMPATQARALCAELSAEDADPDGDDAELERLALWALKLYSPLVAVDGCDGLVIDVTGACGRYGGEAGLVGDLVGRLEGVGVGARAALADTWGAAHALARRAADPTIIAPCGQTGRIIADLPVSALRISAETVRDLGKLGVEHIGEAAALPRSALALRLGLTLIQRLDQAYGREPELIRPLLAEALIRVERRFADPIGSPEALGRNVAHLVEALCRRLEEKGLGARDLDLRFRRVDNRQEIIRVSVSKPVRNVKRLTRLLCDKLETVDPGFGVDVMTLLAVEAEPLREETTNALTRSEAGEVAGLVDILSNRLGPDRLYRARAAPSDIPERSVQRIEATAAPQRQGWPASWPRPARLLNRPEPIETVALLPDQPPILFTWRGVRRRVSRADGPERIFGEWWRSEGEHDAVRDYFQVEDDGGRRFWIFRRGDGERPATGDLSWFLHGLFG